jgi:anti-sigma regulatory factor (Ser/Thr protein kinase)
VAWGAQQAADDLALIASELIGNAIRHGSGGDIEVLLAVREGALVLEVADGGNGTPIARDPAEDDECGRGLLIVEALADKYGWRPNDNGGTTVWARLELPTGWNTG